MASQDIAYPASLASLERSLIGVRRKAAGAHPDAPEVGLALSGGGVRSATFGLGVLQALAAKGLLRRIDYLSTVSGGGYVGAFLTRLFSRKAATPSDVEAKLAIGSSSKELEWLRENGRYLAPTGTGDLLAGGAVMLRNWVSLHVVLALFALMLFLLPQLARSEIDVTPIDAWLGDNVPPAEGRIWWSVYTALAAAVLAFFVVPAGWAFWLTVGGAVDRDRFARLRKAIAVWVGFLLVPTTAAIVLQLDLPEWTHAVCWIAIGVTAATLGLFLSASVLAHLRSTRVIDGEPVFVRDTIRRALVNLLKWALIAFAATAVFALIDSLGQSLYLAMIDENVRFGPWLAAVLATFGGLAPAARYLSMLLPSRKIPPRVARSLAAVASILLFLLLLIAYDAFSHALTWRFERPTTVSEWRWTFPAVVLAWLFVINLLIARSWSFVNDSTFQPLYAARLARAYLGASNERRHTEARRVTDVVPGDDIRLAELWWDATSELSQRRTPPFVPSWLERVVDRIEARFEKPRRRGTDERHAIAQGAPLHLINVTVNETFIARTGLQNRDRRGIGLAVGPAGLSAGVKHHLVRTQDGFEATANGGFLMFGYDRSDLSPFRFEDLTLSQWIGISGAAFSTGMGWRTSLSLSLLMGFFNVRLGYWWNSGVEPSKRPEASRWKKIRRWLRWFPLQTHLFDELVARYQGAAKRWWYLSDGGHFENMGAYELIRRRLPLILIVDAECDTDAEFEGLANLVRKARLDFDAEIRFLTDDEIHPRLRGVFGSLAALRRDRYSRAHAALATVTYGASQEESVIVYMKPTLIGSEPADLLHYHARNPAFPHETTIDQFFGEEQWESYRKLGSLIGEKVFQFPLDKSLVS